MRRLKLLRPEVEQMANELGVQTLVSPAMCGDLGDLEITMDQCRIRRGGAPNHKKKES